MSSSSSSLYHLPSPLCVRHIKREISQAMINSSHFRECTCHIPFIMFWFLSLWKRVGAELSCELWMTFWFGKRLIWKCSKNVLNNFLIVFNEKLLICSLTHMHTLVHTNLHEHVNDGKFMVDDVEIWCKQDLHTVIFVLLHESNRDATSEATTAAAATVVAVMIAPLPNFFLASLFMWCVFFYFLHHFSESYKMFHNAEII